MKRIDGRSYSSRGLVEGCLKSDRPCIFISCSPFYWFPVQKYHRSQKEILCVQPGIVLMLSSHRIDRYKCTNVTWSPSCRRRWPFPRYKQVQTPRYRLLRWSLPWKTKPSIRLASAILQERGACRACHQQQYTLRGGSSALTVVAAA